MYKLADKPRTVRTTAIKVGRRHRRDLGDIDGLAASIHDVGLLHLIVINSNGILVASLGW
jgi:ParB family chromosome partitioning protein